MRKIFLWLLIVSVFIAFLLTGCLGIAAITDVEVDSTNPDGVKFIAPESGSYKITIVGGAYCHLPEDEPNWALYGGWKTLLHMYINKPVERGDPGEWGLRPINFDNIIGPAEAMPSISEAETAGKDSSITVKLDKGEYIILLVYDGSDYYFDNSGTVKVRITKL